MAQRFWKRFEDATFCISLVERKDRRAAVKEEFQRASLQPFVRFFLATRSPRGGECGCFESHVQVMRLGLRSGCEWILVFEDDVCFEIPSARVLDNIGRFLDSGPRCDLLFLGYTPYWILGRTRYPSVVRLTRIWSTHAYIVHRSFAERMATWRYGGVAIDDYLSQRCRRKYGVYPMIALQVNYVSLLC